MAVGGTCHVQVYSQRPHHEYGSDRDGRGHRRHPVCVSVRKTRAQSTCRTGPLPVARQHMLDRLGTPVPSGLSLFEHVTSHIAAEKVPS